MDVHDATLVTVTLAREDAKVLLATAVELLDNPLDDDRKQMAVLALACQLSQALRDGASLFDEAVPPQLCQGKPQGTGSRAAPSPAESHSTSQPAARDGSLGYALFFARLMGPVPRTRPRVSVPAWFLSALVDFALGHFEMGHPTSPAARQRSARPHTALTLSASQPVHLSPTKTPKAAYPSKTNDRRTNRPPECPSFGFTGAGGRRR
jgi:hypothetical protein